MPPKPDTSPAPLNWYGLKKLGYDESVVPLTGDPKKDQVTLESLAFRIGHKHEEGGMGRYNHFKNYVDLLWNAPDSGSMKRCIWNPWANRMFMKMCEEPELVIAGPTSAGKCFSLDTGILMFDGSTKTAGEIVAGDKVMGDDSAPRTVQEVHRGHGPMVRMIPDDPDREPWLCTQDHIQVFRSDLTGREFEVSTREFYSNILMVADAKLFRPNNKVLRDVLKNDSEYNWWVQSKEEFKVTPEHAGDMDWVGFSVDGNHRFLLSDFTVVHNSDPAALYALVSYLTDPTHTLVLILSTTIAGAKKRIWKTMREYWDSVPNLPGKPLWSTNEVRGLNYQGDGYGESSGMYLLASEKSNEKAAMDKLIGLKSPRTGNPGATYEELIAQPEYADLRNHFDEETLRDLIPRLNNLSNDRIGKIVMCVDEATGAVESLLSAVRTNLQPGNVGSFQIIWLGNPANIYDVFGQAAKPAVGWDNVDLIKDDEWRTETGGLCIRFNGEQNPRLTDPEGHRYSWMLRQEDIDKMASTYGRESLFYHRMVLGTWCLTAGESGIYSPADIELSGSRRSEVVWGYTPPTPCSFLDPAFTAGGDRAMARFGLCGIDVHGEHVLLFTGSEAIKVDVNNTTIPVNFQLVHGWKKLCRERGVLPQHAAYDRTGGGIPFGDIVHTQWSPLVTGITSAGPASKNPLPGEFHPGTKKPVLACERFANRASEIWFSAQPYFRSQQIFGVDEDLAKELCTRQLDKKGGTKLKTEDKGTYRSREGKSPDDSDSALGLVDFVKTKFRWTATEKAKARAEQPMTDRGMVAWNAMKERARRITNKKAFKKG